MIKISVIVPVFNSELYLRKCVDSILNQQFTEFELICIDDGSTDDSGKILDEYKSVDKRIKVFHNSNNGVSFSRNFGIEHSTAPYIVFVDSDDYVDEYYLLSLFNGIKDNNQLAICNMNYVDDNYKMVSADVSNQNKKSEYIEFQRNKEKTIAECIDNKKFNFVCGKIFSSETIKSNDIKFDIEVSLGEDTLFVMEYLKYIDGYCLINENHYYYVKHNGSLSQYFRSNMYDFFKATTDSIENLLFIKGLLENEVLVSIDQRRAASAEWVCYALLHNESNDKKENYKKCQNILNEKSLKNSLKRLKRIGKLNNVQKVMNCGYSFILKLYYDKIEGKFKIKHIVKRVLSYLKMHISGGRNE